MAGRALADQVQADRIGQGVAEAVLLAHQLAHQLVQPALDMQGHRFRFIRYSLTMANGR